MAVGVVDDRERLAPVALAAEQPVAQLVVDRAVAGAVRLEPGVGHGDAVGLVVDAVQVERVVGRGDVRRVADERDGPRRRVERRLDAVLGEPLGGRLLDRRDRQAELAGELEVALVAARHRHDRPGAVAHQHVVGDPDRDLLAVDRVDRGRAGEHAGLGLACRPGGRCPSSPPPPCGTRRRRRRGRRVVSSSTSGCSGASTMNDAPNSVSGRVVNTVIGPAGDVEVHAGAVAAADPVALHRLDRVGPVEHGRGRRSGGRRTR